MYQRILFFFLFLLLMDSLSAQLSFSGSIYESEGEGNFTAFDDFPVAIVDPQDSVIELLFTDENGFFIWSDPTAAAVPGESWSLQSIDICNGMLVEYPVLIEAGTVLYNDLYFVCYPEQANPNDYLIVYDSDQCRSFFTPIFPTDDSLTVNFWPWTTPDYVSFAWDFGDGNTSTDTFGLHTYDAPGVYLVTMTTTFSSGCTFTTEVVLDLLNNLITNEPSFRLISSTSSPTLEDARLSIFPNPTWDRLNIQSELTFNRIEMMNALGQSTLLYQGTAVSNWDGNIPDWPAGHYYLRISGAEGSTLRSVVKQ